ncbi:MAG: hypothetical protein ABIJ16_08175, partial [Bacteroidota bacterium]
PVKLKDLTGIESMEIRNNEGIDMEKSIPVIASMKSLKNLDLSVNLLTDLPKNVGSLTQIENLNISCNNLRDLPREVNRMENLDSLKVEENILNDPVEALSRLKGLKLKYLSIDGGLSEEERKAISELFPDTKIEEKEIMLPVEFNIDIPEDEDSSEVQTQYQTFGTISASRDTFRAFSTAYLHFPRLFHSERFRYEFDTLMFDERYLDLNYAGTNRIQPGGLYSVYNVRTRNLLFCRNIYFDFIKKGSLYTSYYEIYAFNSMVWAYKGPMSKKEFRKQYCKKDKWLDMRLYYNEPEKDFTVELKSLTGFSSFKAFPVLAHKRNDMIESQKEYMKRYSKYLMILERRKKHFHNLLFREKRTYDLAYKKSYENQWKAFRKMYMSSEERKMSRDEWLEYYDKVIANEKKALFSSSGTVNNLKRSLDLEKYFNSISENRLSNTNNITVSFVNEAGETLPVVSLIFINTSRRCYYTLKGTLGLIPQLVYLDKMNMEVIAELRNGDIAYIGKKELIPMDLIPGKTHALPMKVIDKKLCTVGQLIELFGL